jgi:hypothetical protein
MLLVRVFLYIAIAPFAVVTFIIYGLVEAARLLFGKDENDGTA